MVQRPHGPRLCPPQTIPKWFIRRQIMEENEIAPRSTVHKPRSASPLRDWKASDLCASVPLGAIYEQANKTQDLLPASQSPLLDQHTVWTKCW